MGVIAFVPASLIGAKLAERIVDRIPQEKFRLVIAALLQLAGRKLLLLP